MGDGEMTMEEIAEMLSRKNHRVLILCEQQPSIGGVVSRYLKDVRPGVVSVNRSRFGVVYLLANGANLTFMVNDPGRYDKYQLVVDERKKADERMGKETEKVIQ